MISIFGSFYEDLKEISIDEGEKILKYLAVQKSFF